ncbi:unnamed protein product [Paramecium octaurelia]|uniref:Uncharacterized protein n=1 Tax=Paramecium octaurelia TaxID=43137 RepID=A0A8S1TXE5_PAROT|nr:unnamed protein product [Paramecium octaurelia]
MKFLEIGIIKHLRTRQRLKYYIQIKHVIHFFQRILKVEMITASWYFNLRRQKFIARFKLRQHSLCLKIIILIFKKQLQKIHTIFKKCHCW